MRVYPDGVEGDAPAEGLAEAAADGVAQRAADGDGEVEEADDEGPLVVRVEVQQHRGRDGRVGRLAHPHQAADAYELQRKGVRCERG